MSHTPDDSERFGLDAGECVVLTQGQWRALLGGILAAVLLAIAGSAWLTFTFRDEVRDDAGIVDRAQRGHHLCRTVPACRAEFRKLERASR